MVNWGLQKEVWNRIFRHVVHANPPDTHLLLTEPLLNLPNVQDTMHQVIFEEYGFRSAYCCPPSVLSCWQACQSTGSGGGMGMGATSAAAARAGAALVVDAGFSSTTVAPFFDGRLLESSVRRINLGGKLLTNYFKELVSYRCEGGCVCVWFSPPTAPTHTGANPPTYPSTCFSCRNPPTWACTSPLYTPPQPCRQQKTPLVPPPP